MSRLARRVIAALIAIAAVFTAASPASAQGVTPRGVDPSLAPVVSPAPPVVAPSTTPQDPSAAPLRPSSGPALTLSLGGDDGRIGTALEIVLLMTVLSLAPAIVLTMTCFTRIIIVLSFLKRAMSLQEFPPTTVVTGFALFMTVFIMKPVGSDVYEQAWVPYSNGTLDFASAADVAMDRLKRFMLHQTRPDDVELVLGLAKELRPATPDDLPFHVAVPAFVLSEIKTAFQMGFVLFLPFVVIDLVVSSILVSMGMFTLPPVVVSTPLKLMLFLLVDGWNLVVLSLAESFTTS